MRRGVVFLRSKAWLIALALILLAGAALRLDGALPPERGLLFAADTDEGIYAASARLVLDGRLPYRDYFCSAPPLALYMFMSVLAPTSQPWGDVAGFMALRYASTLYGMISLLAIFAIGRRLGGNGAGLLAAALLAIDGWVVGQDRRAMLEAPMMMHSALAMLAFVAAGERRPTRLRWYVLAGALAACAMLSKTQGMVVVAALLLTAALQRRGRAAAALLAGFAVAYGALALPFLLLAGDDYLRQLFVFQFLRPANGDPALMLRVNAMRNFAESWLTLRLGLIGGGLLALRWLWQALAGRRAGAESARLPSAWLPVAVWAGLVALSFAASKTFYLYYYVQLAPALALLAGSLLHPWPAGSTQRAARLVARLAPVAVLALLGLLAALRLPDQAQATLSRVRWQKPAYAAIAGALADTPATARALVFEPNYAFLASRETAPAGDGRYLLDIHAYMLYTNLGIEGDSWAGLLTKRGQGVAGSEQTLLWQEPAQEMVRQAFAGADYVVVDARARYLLTPETVDAIEAGSEPVTTFEDVTLRARR